MSDKASSNERRVELTGDEISEKETNAIADVLFDDAMAGFRNAFRLGVSVAEHMEDNNAAFWGGIFGNECREKHTKKLEEQAHEALKQGRVDAAKHLLKRDVAYTMGTQGFDDEDSQRLLKEIFVLQVMEKQRSTQPTTSIRKPYEMAK